MSMPLSFNVNLFRAACMFDYYEHVNTPYKQADVAMTQDLQCVYYRLVPTDANGDAGWTVLPEAIFYIDTRGDGSVHSQTVVSEGACGVAWQPVPFLLPCTPLRPRSF